MSPRLLLLLILMTAGAVALTGCRPCKTYTYGRYTLRVDCDRVKIAGEEYALTRAGEALYLGGHPVTRGVYRMSQPWLYVHRIAEDEVDVTFDEAKLGFYPIYTGSMRAIFKPFLQPCDVRQSSSVQFGDSLWLVLHTWTDEGIVGDVNRREGSEEEWSLVRGDILIPADGVEIPIVQLNARVRCTAYDPDEQTAMLVFTKARW
jgi:hypothetical protein